VPRAWHEVSPWLNWASITMLAALVYYGLISLRLALGMIPCSRRWPGPCSGSQATLATVVELRRNILDRMDRAVHRSRGRRAAGRRSSRTFSSC